MNARRFLTVFCCGVLIQAIGYARPARSTQTPEAPKEKVENLAGTQWDGSIDWTEKSRIQGRLVDVPYMIKMSFKLLADGTCTNNKRQPCKWEQKGQTAIINVERTKSECPGSASLTLQGKMMSGTWEHYGGFTCFRIPPPRQITLKRHK
jgi:hypothetical protein